MTSPAIVGLNTIFVRLFHPIEGLGGLLTKFFWHDGFLLFELPTYSNVFKIYEHILCASDHKLLNFLV